MPQEIVKKLANHLIIKSTCEKILAIFIDTKLHFTEHIYDCVRKASKMSNLILSNLHQTKKNTNFLV